MKLNVMKWKQRSMNSIEVNSIEESKAQFMPQFNLHFIPLRRCGIEVNWMQAMNEGGIRCVHFISFPRVEAEIEKKLNGNEAMNEWAALPSSFVIHSSLISLR